MRGTDVSQFRFPEVSHRTAVYGRTGSGKTVFGWWLLSEQPFDRMPYIVLDYKGDDLIRKTPRLEQISLNDKLPKHPGVYVVRPIPDTDDERVANLLMRIWTKRRTGLFVDEGYMVPKCPAWNGILTQGRSQHIPVFNLSQRPVWLSRFVQSQADFHALFHFNDDDDTKSVSRYLPKDIPIYDRLPDHHSWWYDVNRDIWFQMGAAPHPDEIVARFDERLSPTRRVI